MGIVNSFVTSHDGSEQHLPTVKASLLYGIAPGEEVRLSITDALPAASQFRIDECGFQLTTVDGILPADLDWHDRMAVRRRIYPMAEEIARRVCGAKEALAFNHIRRHSDCALEGAPVFLVHSDIRIGKGLQHARALLEEHFRAVSGSLDAVESDLATSLNGRVAFVNVWLPTSSQPIQREPLAMCDWRSRPSSLDDWVGEVAVHHPSHKWYFYSGLKAGQALIFKQWDSSYQIFCCQDHARSTISRETLHTAFRLPSESTTMSPRESCEIRVLVLFGDTLPKSMVAAFRAFYQNANNEEYNIFL